MEMVSMNVKATGGEKETLSVGRQIERLIEDPHVEDAGDKSLVSFQRENTETDYVESNEGCEEPLGGLLFHRSQGRCLTHPDGLQNGAQ